MSIAIMQPYFFPYIGYFQLIQAVDIFVIADDLNYIKNGFINKNFILRKNECFRISLQLKGASQNKLINEIEVGENASKLLNTIRENYRRAPYFDYAFPLLESILSSKEKNLARYLGDLLINISKYFGLETTVLYSSEIDKDNDLRFDERIIDICQRLKQDKYINPARGKNLYNKEDFLKEGIQLSFLKKKDIEYKQFDNQFVHYLSIIDVLMFNSKEEIKELLLQYNLV